MKIKTTKPARITRLICLAMLLILFALIFPFIALSGCGGGGGGGTGGGGYDPVPDPTTAKTTLKGTVVDAEGNPVPYATVYLSYVKGSGLLERAGESATADENGNYTFTNVEVGRTARIEAHDQSGTFLGYQDVQVQENQPEVQITPSAPPPSPTPTVSPAYTPTATPSPWPTVSPSPGQAYLRISSNPSGLRIYLDGVNVGTTPETVGTTPGTHTIAVKSSSGTVYGTKTISVKDQEVVEVFLGTSSSPTPGVSPSPSPVVTPSVSPGQSPSVSPSIGEVVITVVDYNSNEPISEALVQLSQNPMPTPSYSPDSKTIYSEKYTGETGTACWTDIPTGSYIVKIEKNAYYPTYRDIIINPGLNNMTVKVQPTTFGDFNIQILDDDTYQPIEGFYVLLYRRIYLDDQIHFYFAPIYPDRYTNTNGMAFFQDLTPGEYRVVMQKTEYGEWYFEKTIIPGVNSETILLPKKGTYTHENTEVKLGNNSHTSLFHKKRL